LSSEYFPPKCTSIIFNIIFSEHNNTHTAYIYSIYKI
jgi:hypothetical protein